MIRKFRNRKISKDNQEDLTIMLKAICLDEEDNEIRGLYDEDPLKFQDDLAYDLSYDDTSAFLRDDSRPRSNTVWPWWLIP